MEGAHPTMLQRSSALVFTREKGVPILVSPVYWHNSPPPDVS